jgi:predicted transcriptional regulator
MSGIDLKIERIKCGVKQLELARQTGINPTRLSKIECGWIEPRDQEVEMIRDRLERSKQAGVT